MTVTAPNVTHTLDAIQPSAKGHYAICSCGNETDPYPVPAAARAAHNAHAGWEGTQVASTSTTPQKAAQRKNEGQARSLWDATASDVDAVRAAIEKIPAGELFSANDLRDALDAAGIEPKKRAGLIKEAVADGLAAPLTWRFRGDELPYKVPSTGETANGASVVLYRRASATPIPPPVEVA